MAASSLTVMVQLQDKVTAPARQATKAVDQFTNKVEQSRRGLNQYGENMGKATRDTRKFAMTGLQQAGYQVGDFAVQVGGGTSAMVAFGQQGSQLLGIFGPMGAVLGAVVAITAAVGNAFMKSAEEASDFAKATEGLDSAMSSLSLETMTTKGAADFLKEEYGKVSESTIKAAEAQALYNAVLAQNKLNNASVALRNFAIDINKAAEVTQLLNRDARGIAALSTMFENLGYTFSTSLEDISSEMGVNEAQALKLRDAFMAVGNSTGEEQINAATAALNELRETTLMGTEKGAELAKALNSIIIANSKLEGQDLAAYLEAIRNAKNATDELSKGQIQLAESVSSAFATSFSSVIRGTQSTSDAFRNMANKIIDQLYDVLIVQRIVGMVGTGGKGSGSGLSGSIADLFRANGGPVSGGKPYVVGEAGPELFVPGGSGTIIPNKNMGGGGGATVVQNINISTGVSQTVRAEIVQLMPQIVGAAKSGVLDAKKRGGAYGAAF